jgi:hypothetical protein
MTVICFLLCKLVLFIGARRREIDLTNKVIFKLFGRF